MPILSKVGRKTWGQRVTRATFYALLTVGAVVILYPMMLVVGQALSNRFDLRDNALIPRYLYDRNELALKSVFSQTRRLTTLASRYNLNSWNSHSLMRQDHGFFTRQPLRFERMGLRLEARERILEDFNEFKRRQDPADVMVRDFRIEDPYYAFVHARFGAKADELLAAIREEGKPPLWLRQMFPEPRHLRRALRNRSRLALAIMNDEFQSDYSTLMALEIIGSGNLVVPVWRPRFDAKWMMWEEFVRTLDPGRILLVSSDTYWHEYLRMRYNDRIGQLNRAWGTEHEGFFEISLSLEPPEDPAVRRDWDRFITARWPRRLLTLPEGYHAEWQAKLQYTLRARVGGDESTRDERALKELSRLTGEPVGRWEDVRLPREWPPGDTMGRFWNEFTMSGAIPAEEMILRAPELEFPAFLRDRYRALVPDGDEAAALAELNRAWMSDFAGFDEIPLPLEFSDFIEPAFHARALRWSFATESFARVYQYLVGRGRAIQNTIILIVLSLASALTINPLAAYSLSRFSMKQSHRILILFLATMAFPPAVSMIPVFLLLRDLGLLNTYAALILPSMANGYSIFLLKCFFDSLPKELYEAAEIDGATEAQTFRLVAIPLIKPILAYVGLLTFVNAYNGFMWAFVICPQQHMWTIMVWIFDFQSRNPGYNYTMASVLLASTVPLTVFLFVNKIIMKGIMIPQMK